MLLEGVDMLKKLFTNDKFFSTVSVIGFIGAIIYSIGCFLFWTDILFSSYISAAIYMLINGVLVLILYISYKKHLKNLMKGVVGALLMGEFATVCTLTFPIIDTFPLDIICNFILLALTLVLLINHFIINTDHHSNKTNVSINQWCSVLIAADAVVWSIAWIPHLDSSVAIVFQLITSIASISTMASVVCVESRLDAYRLDREAAGWTEEKGYPEGYVHEYEKK